MKKLIILTILILFCMKCKPQVVADTININPPYNIGGILNSIDDVFVIKHNPNINYKIVKTIQIDKSYMIELGYSSRYGYKNRANVFIYIDNTYLSLKYLVDQSNSMYSFFEITKL